ncbi:hypothetical protein DPMN_064349 [Dreissena polymorpha]|uniref:Uncharacterized protein n=1 Tax=Dreissena polymorpha TaxID=45954 RepID=A0A9D4HK09_DREPO|nr:hypothetical protein DPMN_064349 [Dreissena polymorpha]
MEAYYKVERKHLVSSQVLATYTAEGDSQVKHQNDLKSLQSAIQQLQNEFLEWKRQSNSVLRSFQPGNTSSDRPRNNFRTPRWNPRRANVPRYNNSQRSNTNASYKMNRSTDDKGGEVKKSSFNRVGLFFVTAHIDGKPWLNACQIRLACAR